MMCWIEQKKPGSDEWVTMGLKYHPGEAEKFVDHMNRAAKNNRMGIDLGEFRYECEEYSTFYRRVKDSVK